MLAIRLAPDAPEGTTVTRDAIDLRSASLGASLPVDPGAHQVVVSAPGHSERRFVVDIKEGEQKELVVGPGPAIPPTAPVAVVPPPAPAKPPPAARPPEPAPKSTHADTKMLGYVIGGVGVAGIGTALVLGAVALGKKHTLAADNCNAQTRTCDSQEGVDAASAGSTLATASTVTFIVGAAAVGAGLYFILTSGESNSTKVGASAAPGGGAIRLVHRF